MDRRTRWTIGLLLALVIGLAVGLIIVVGDDSSNNSPSTIPLQSISVAAPTTTSQTTTQVTTTRTTPNGGTPAPGSTTTSPNGTGGL